MSAEFADPLLLFPGISVKNTFLHCGGLAASAKACRSTSCPPRHPWKPSVAAAAAVGTDGSSHIVQGAAEEDAAEAGDIVHRSVSMGAQCSSLDSEGHMVLADPDGSSTPSSAAELDRGIAAASMASMQTVKRRQRVQNRKVAASEFQVPGAHHDAEPCRDDAAASSQATAETQPIDAVAADDDVESSTLGQGPDGGCSRGSKEERSLRTPRALRPADVARLLSLVARGPPPYAPPSWKSAVLQENVFSEDVDCEAQPSGSASVRQIGECQGDPSEAAPAASAGTSGLAEEESASTGQADGPAESEAARGSQETTADDAGEWAVVETRRKKRPGPSKPPTSQGGEEAAARQPAEYLQCASALPRTGSTGGASLIHHQLEVGIADDAEFRVVKRLIGVGGENMRRITSECAGTKVELRGAGTKSLRDDTGDENGPLVLHIKGHDAAQCAKALGLVSQLVSDMKKEHQTFLASGSLDVACSTSHHAVQDRLESLGQLTGKNDSDRACDTLSSPEDSTSADDSAAAPHEATDSDADDLPGSDPRTADSCKADRRRPERETGAQIPRLAGSSPATASSAPVAMIHHELPVGIEQSSTFSVVRRLIGPGGENMKFITSQCPGTKVELRGEGTNPWSGGEVGPLVMHVRGRDPEQCAAALGLATELIADVRKEHQQFLDSKEKRWA